MNPLIGHLGARTGRSLAPTEPEPDISPSSPATLRSTTLGPSYRPPTTIGDLSAQRWYHSPPAPSNALGNNSSGVAPSAHFATTDPMKAAASLFKQASELPGTNRYIEGRFRIDPGGSYLETWYGTHLDRASNWAQGKPRPEAPNHSSRLALHSLMDGFTQSNDEADTLM